MRAIVAYYGRNYVRDLFNRANGNITGDALDEGGGTWATATSATGSCQILTNQLTGEAGVGPYHRANYVDSTISSGFISFLTNASNAGVIHEFGFRLATTPAVGSGGFTSGYTVRVLVSATASSVELFRNGTSVVSSTIDNSAVATEIYAVEAQFSGAGTGGNPTIIRVWVNGVLEIDQSLTAAADASLATNTVVGVGVENTSAGNENGAIDDFFVTDVPSCPGAIGDVSSVTPNAVVPITQSAAGTAFPDAVDTTTVHIRTATIRTVTSAAAEDVEFALLDDNGTAVRALASLGITGDGKTYNRLNALAATDYAWTTNGQSGGTTASGTFRMQIRQERNTVVAWRIDSEELAEVEPALTTANGGRGYSIASTTVDAIAVPTGAPIDFVYPETHIATVTIAARPIRIAAATRLDDLEYRQSTTVKKTVVPTTDWSAATPSVQTFPSVNCDTDFASAAVGVGTGVSMRFDIPVGPAALNTEPLYYFTAFPSGFGYEAGATVYVPKQLFQSGGSTETDTAFDANPAIFVYKSSGLTTTGIGVFSSSGYTTAQDIFKRRGTVNTTNAIPFLETFVTDAGPALLSGVSLVLQTRRSSDNVVENTQTQATGTGGTVGRERWNYTITADLAAFNRFVKTGTSRDTGSHVATGPDNPASPPATFSVGNGAYTGPFPAYGREVNVVGNAFAGTKEPSRLTTLVFGLNSEIIFEDIWTGLAVNAALDGNGVPTGAGQREQTLGAGSLRAKATTLIDEGNVTVINVGEYNPKDVAGRNIDLAGAEVLSGRRAIWDVVNATPSDAGTNLSNSHNLDEPLGYATGTPSLDSIAAPADPGSFFYYQAYKDTAQGNEASEDANGFLLTTYSTNVGFQTDTGNYGYIEQAFSFIAVDLTIACILTPAVSQSDPGLTQRFGCKTVRITADNQFADAVPDSAPLYGLFGLNTDGSQTLISYGTMTAVPATTTEFYVDVVIPTGYFAVKLRAFAKINGARTPGGDGAQVQIGYTFDGVDFATGLPFK